MSKRLHSSRSNSRIPSAVTFCRKLNGKSQPSIILTTGAELFVVKFQGFAGTRALLSEVLGAELMSFMKLPHPEWSPILVTDEFLDRTPQIWWESAGGGGKRRPQAGLHFGSRLVLSDGKASTYQIIPPAWDERILNLDDFPGILLLDLWTNNCDRRQFITLSENGSLRVLFLDNDHLLGGCSEESTNARYIMGCYRRFYKGIRNQRLLDRWKRKLEKIDGTVLDNIFKIIPRDWADESSIRWAREQLEHRRKALEMLLSDSLRLLDEPSPMADIGAVEVL